MRICFYNPHVVDNVLGISVNPFIFGHRGRKKHLGRFDFLLKMMRDKKYNTAIVVDGTASSFPLASLGSVSRNRFFLKLVAFIEIYSWCLIHGINPFGGKVILATIIILFIISIYDMWAVWHSKVMQKMAEFQMNNLKFFTGFFVPYADKKEKEQDIKEYVAEIKRNKGEKYL